MKPTFLFAGLSLLLVLASSCGRNEASINKAEVPQNPTEPRRPLSLFRASDSPDAVADVLWDQLEQRGHRNGDQLTTIIRYPDSQKEQLITLGKIQIISTPLTLTTPQELNGWKWRSRVEVKFWAERLAEQNNGLLFAEWRNPKFTLIRMNHTLDEDGDVFTETIVGHRRGQSANLWDFKLLSNERSLFFSQVRYSWDEVPQDGDQWADILDSRLSHCQNPALESRARAARFAIRDVLWNDARGARESIAKTAKRLGVPEKEVKVEDQKVEYLPSLRAMNLNDCPKDFSLAFQKHVEAWETGGKSAVSSTWEMVEKSARRHRVGTCTELYLTSEM